MLPNHKLFRQDRQIEIKSGVLVYSYKPLLVCNACKNNSDNSYTSDRFEIAGCMRCVSRNEHVLAVLY